MILLSGGRFDDMAYLNPQTGSIQYFSRKARPECAKEIPEGKFDQIDGHLLLLYTYNKTLSFRFDETVFVVNEATRTSFMRSPSKQTLMLYDGTDLILKVEYAPPIIDPPLDADPFRGMEEEEDFDFGLFVHNVFSDELRRKGWHGIRDV